jgi:signal transduction histidine kinase
LGRIIWKSEKWQGYNGKIPYEDLHRATAVFDIPIPSGKTYMLASAQDVTIDESSSRGSMLSEFPEAVRKRLQSDKPGQEVIATEIEYADERFRYEVITRAGDDLYEIDMNEDGVILEETPHHVPKELPGQVKEALERKHPKSTIESFDWRASQGYLQFLVNGVSEKGEKFREAINSSGQVVPLYFPPGGKPPAHFRIIAGDEQRWRHGLMRELGWILAGVCGSGLIAAWLLSVWLAERALQPMGSIARKARLIDEKRLSDRLSGGRPDDEIGILVGAINGMLDRIEQAFERQRRFARDASHELRGPLTGLISQLELARSQLPSGDTAGGHLDRALERGQRMRDLIDKLLMLARQESDQPVAMRQDIEIDECMGNVVADFPDSLRERIRLSPLDGQGDGRFVHGNEELLHAMFRNIIENALKYSGPEERVDVSIRQDDTSIQVEVSDRGAGIPSAAREKIFEPFVRLRAGATSQVEGSGLGLSIVKWIADLHRVRLEIDCKAGEGTRFRVILPEAKEAPA